MGGAHILDKLARHGARLGAKGIDEVDTRLRAILGYRIVVFASWDSSGVCALAGKQGAAGAVGVIRLGDYGSG